MFVLKKFLKQKLSFYEKSVNFICEILVRKKIKSQFGGLEGVEQYKGYISYCNTGHWAATVWFGLSEIAQIPNVKMYDGGMTHWTSNPKRKVDLG